MTDLKELLQQRYAIDMLLAIAENPDQPITTYCQQGQCRTKFLRIVEWEKNGYVRWNKELVQHNTKFCNLTEKGWETAYAIKLLLRIGE